MKLFNIKKVQLLTSAVVKLLARIFLRPVVTGSENLFYLLEMQKKENKGIIIISNHISAIDPFLIAPLMPWKVKQEIFPITLLGKNDLFSNALKDTVMRSLGCIPVYGYSNMKKAVECLSSCGIILIFPEGHASKTGELKKDTGGIRKFAHFCDFIVQPARISGITLWREDWWKILTFQKVFQIRFGKPLIIKKDKNCQIDATEIIRKI